MLSKYYDSMLKPDIFDALFYGMSIPRTKSHFSSDARVETTESGLSLTVDLPGVKHKDLSVEVVGRDVKVSATVRGEELKYSYRISRDYEPDTLDALLEDGVLTLSFKRARTTDTRRVEVRTR